MLNSFEILAIQCGLSYMNISTLRGSSQDFDKGGAEVAHLNGSKLFTQNIYISVVS